MDKQTPFKKIRVGILFGGQSAEHDISIQSAKNVVEALDKTKFEPILINIDKQGVWRLCDSLTIGSTSFVPGDAVTLLPGNTHTILTAKNHTKALDVMLPILHGPKGEDGSVQGLLELANIPYVGSSIVGSAIGMDKDIMKRLLRDAGLNIAPFATLKKGVAYNAEELMRQLGKVVFVKPANMGSSVGVSKASTVAQLKKAINLAFTYDQKILIETAIEGDEIECAILGDKVSVPGRIALSKEFYTYEAKYLDEQGTILEIPAILSPDLTTKVQAVALKVFKTLEARDFARVDMFLTKDGKVVVNEINTIPGFTKQSMYPQLWKASGIYYSDLITTLLTFALSRERQ